VAPQDLGPILLITPLHMLMRNQIDFEQRHPVTQPALKQVERAKQGVLESLQLT
jgi:hypothetical protein